MTNKSKDSEKTHSAPKEAGILGMLLTGLAVAAWLQWDPGIKEKE